MNTLLLLISSLILVTQILGEKQANIVVIVCDSMDGRIAPGGRYQGVVQLPHLGRLARKGVTYQSAYSNSPVCVPSRSALWSGMHTHITETWNNHEGLPLDFNDTWEDRLRTLGGYETKVLGVVDNRAGAHSVSNRVEAWTRNVNFTLRQEGRPTVELVGNESTIRVAEHDWEVVDKAVDYITSKNPHSFLNPFVDPFLLYVGVRSPHPYSTPSEGENAGDSTFKTSPHWLKEVSEDVHIPDWLPREKMHPVDLYSTIVKNCSSEFTRQEQIDIKRYYYAMCAETDAMVGKILDALEKAELLDSTYVFFTADHGELAMEHRQFYKMSMFEGSVHVPLILSYPEKSTYQSAATSKEVNRYERRSLCAPAGSFFYQPVSLIDIYPTLLHIALLEIPDHLNGTSLFEMDSYVIFSQFHGSDVNASTYMMQMGPWKYLAYDFGSDSVRSQLFHIDEDPDELNDVTHLYPDLVRDLDKYLRSKIDYPAVTQKVREYNWESFTKWRADLGDDYQETIANLRWWKDWQRDPVGNQKAIDDWLKNSHL